ncbi:tripartite tricarboxylate transporter TctB family protein [Paenalcaligenes hermetiae]|uniref:DUF1468 domain-containing protein n=1 Tax=Paenalcaligenes hermetiae TaxID=1157987 RepID=A0ABP9M4C7_9BURK
MQRISTSHLVFLVLVSACAVYLNWSAISASATLFNLIIIVPSGALVLGLAAFILLNTKDSTSADTDATSKQKQRKALLGDLLLLTVFAVFCLSLTTVGFDVATFLFVWLGVVLGGARNWIVPPIYSAVFTFALTKGFGSLFPFPMPLMVF